MKHIKLLLLAIPLLLAGCDKQPNYKTQFIEYLEENYYAYTVGEVVAIEYRNKIDGWTNEYYFIPVNVYSKSDFANNTYLKSFIIVVDPKTKDIVQIGGVRS